MRLTQKTALAVLLCATLASAARADEVDDYLKAQIEKQHIPGLSLAVVKDGQIVKAAGYGLANVELGVPAAPETVYKIGSVSKQFIAAGILLLVEDGKLGLDDKISRYLEGTPESWAPITVRQLLAHTSGLAREAPGFSPVKIQPDADVLRTVYPLPLRFEPGAKWAYSNAGYFALGEIIARVSGQPWAELLEQRIFSKLDMKATRATTMDEVVPHRAGGYAWRGKSYKNAATYLAVRPSGALLSSVLDLAKWDAALYSDAVLKESTRQAMWKPIDLNNGKQHGYGLGWTVGPLPGQLHHGGSLPGFRAELSRFTDDKLTVIILTNSDSAKPGPMAVEVAKHYIPGLAEKVAAQHARQAAEPGRLETAYHEQGELAGSLKSDAPLAIYDDDPRSLVNRLFAALYIRPSEIPTKRGGAVVRRIEGGDGIDFLAWPQSEYWSSVETTSRLSALLDECLQEPARFRPNDSLRRALLQRDLWAAFDFLVSRNIAREGDLATRQRRDAVCRKLAQVIRLLTLSEAEVQALPNTYALAVQSGQFASEHGLDPAVDYLPPGLLTADDEWQEIDFFQPSDIHEDIQERFLTLHTRNYQGRSYFRVFYRFPQGRKQLEEYLKYVDAERIEWRKSAQRGFIQLRDGIRQIPVGTEVALVQFLVTLDDQLRPTPTPIVESVRLRVFANVDGSNQPPTNTGVGMNVSEYTLKRRLLFDDLRAGGLEREPDDRPLYRVIFQGDKAPDWGDIGRSLTLAQDCRRCHTGAGQVGAQTIFSMIHQGGVDAGAQLGVAHPLAAGAPSPRGPRGATWKSRHETYRRLLEYVGQ